MMKKNLLATALLLSGFINAQIPVTDVATNGQLGLLNTTTTSTYAKMGEQVVTAAKQLAQLEKTYNTVKEAADKVEKVNKAVSSYNDIEKFIDTQKEIITNLNKVNSAKKAPVSRTQLQNLLNSTTRSLSKIQDFLSDDFFNLNDKERIDLVKEESRKLEINLIRSKLYANSVK